ncbi:hypothetical protein GF312_12875 [Candidatus Poribacteria bacterium]|nr:hypothetical protein [Candidatus Poribacteria bacterium]
MSKHLYSKAFLTLFVFSLVVFSPVYSQGFTSGQDDAELLSYAEKVRENPDSAEAHKKLGLAYAKRGMFEEASREFEVAMDLEYKRGKAEGTKREYVKIYTSYTLISIAVGLVIAAIVVLVLAWSEALEKLQAFRRNKRIRNFTKNFRNLDPSLQKQASEIIQSKEKLMDAINQENDTNLKGAAAIIIPKLEDLMRQASLLLKLRQTLTGYVDDIDYVELDREKRNCEEKLKRETDEEAKRALDYQLKQIKNKINNYSKAEAKIRTCDAVLRGITARIDSTSLDLMSLPSVLLKKQDFFERVSAELDEEIKLTRHAAETVMEETS